MKTAFATAVLAAASAYALPAKRAVTDTDILQYALTLEHLENAFYSWGLAKWTQADFAAAGFPDWVRNRVEQIAGHEAQHVALLSGALGTAATQPCSYTFPVTDPASFMAVATIIENVGVSAYLGAASSITEAAYVTVAGSILTTESRHQAWLGSSVTKGAAWSGPEDTPLDFSEVYSIASAFITACPATNPTLPVKAFPALTVGSDGTITTTASTDGTYVQVLSGLASAVYPVVNGKAVGLPTPQGISYFILTTSSDNSKVSDDNIVAGPYIMSNVFSSKETNPAPSF